MEVCNMRPTHPLIDDIGSVEHQHSEPCPLHFNFPFQDVNCA